MFSGFPRLDKNLLSAERKPSVARSDANSRCTAFVTADVNGDVYFYLLGIAVFLLLYVKWAVIIYPDVDQYTALRQVNAR